VDGRAPLMRLCGEWDVCGEALHRANHGECRSLIFASLLCLVAANVVLRVLRTRRFSGSTIVLFLRGACRFRGDLMQNTEDYTL
jgi:hypothetical protein